MSPSRTRHGLLLLVVGLICLGGWSLIQFTLGAGRNTTASPTGVMRPITRAHLPRTVLLTSFAEPLEPLKIVLKYKTPADITKELTKLNYDDVKTGFALEVTGFADEQKTGRLEILAGRETIHTLNLADDKTPVGASQTIDPLDVKALLDQGEKEIVAVWTPTEGEPQTSDPPLSVKIDTRGPILDTATLTGNPDIGVTLVLRFTEDDLDPVSAKAGANYFVGGATADPETWQEAAVDDGQVVHQGKVVRLYLGRLKTGNYRIKVNGSTEKKATDNQTVIGPLLDISGNAAGGQGETRGQDQIRFFSSLPQPETGKHIEFPEFLPPGPKPKPKFNPSDRVETRVVRLYYFRDAHRVAQIVNRTAKAYNRAAVEQARLRAQDARKKADELTDERRKNEREAVRAAEALRRAENQLQAQMDQVRAKQTRKDNLPTLIANNRSELKTRQRELREVRTTMVELNTRIKDRKKEIGDTSSASNVPRNTPVTPADLQTHIRRLPEIDGLAPASLPQTQDAPQGPFLNTTFRHDPSEEEAEDPELKTLNEELADAQEQEQRLQNRINALETEHELLDAEKTSISTGIEAEEGKIPGMNDTIAMEREEAARLNEKALQATAAEDRAREEQFRLEVGAAHEDPDTYAPAKVDSIDPVAQVSISVIGEGVLELRGPRKGLDKIRTMIHRIDSPLGQVKVEVVTVQLNGERGDRMEKPVGMVDAHLGLGRFLTAQSLMMLRRAIQMEAATIAVMHDRQGHYQIDRDRKYLYAFFGRDFIDELYEMDSEFLNSQNKLLSLHSMDTISLHRALFTLALARNDVRQRIICNFMKMVQCELPQVEFDYRRSSELRPHRSQKWVPPWNKARLPLCDKPEIEACTLEACLRNARQRYHFRNLRGFFANEIYPSETMNPAQREFIRLAQIFKARMIAEVELKQRIIERGLVEDERQRSFDEEEDVRTSLRTRVIASAKSLQQTRFDASESLATAITDLRAAVVSARSTAIGVATGVRAHSVRAQEIMQDTRQVKQSIAKSGIDVLKSDPAMDKVAEMIEGSRRNIEGIERCLQRIREVCPQTEKAEALYEEIRTKLRQLDGLKQSLGEASRNLEAENRFGAALFLVGALSEYIKNVELIKSVAKSIESLADLTVDYWNAVDQLTEEFAATADVRKFDWKNVVAVYTHLENALASRPEHFGDLLPNAAEAYKAAQDVSGAETKYDNAKYFLSRTRSSLDRKKLLDHLIDERQEKYIDILEGTRAHIASMDNYLKRLAIAMEDDFKVQFYDPAFVRIREAARQWDVSLGVVERTSILTNNRAFAKVEPQATMEFDLPKRDILIKEALDGAKALSQDMGALLNDPTFLAAFKMMGGGGSPTKVQNVMPGLPSSTDEQLMGVTQGGQRELGASLEALIPDPAIYKFETGTGFEIRPVIQPDGNSIVYDFTYLYTTNIREPVRADEKHLGRVKRHFINTQVQTSSFEMREISRYQVALKAARTSQGVPLLQDLPGIGLAFRPLPSAESSIQQNIILGHSVVYPTLFDLMGLRWAPSVVDLNHISVRDSEHIVRGRYDAITNSVFDTTSRRVDEMLDIPLSTPQHHRPDLHHRQTQPSPYHPGGYTAPMAEQMEDPTGRRFEVPDRRPAEWREPPYDPRFRSPIRYESVPYQGPTELSEPIPPAETAPFLGPNQGGYRSGPPAYHVPRS